jgi:hypothetical protein
MAAFLYNYNPDGMSKNFELNLAEYLKYVIASERLTLRSCQCCS